MAMDPQKAKAQAMIWWTLWAAFQVSIFFYYKFLVRAPSVYAPAQDIAAWPWAMAPVFVSAVLRWTILPRCVNAQNAIAVFIVGIACAETSCFLGIFLFPSHSLELSAISTLGILQFAPYYVGRFET